MAIIRKRHDFIEGPENAYVDKTIVYRMKLKLYQEELGLTDEEVAADIAVMDKVISKKEAKDIAVANASAKIEDFKQARTEETHYMRNRRPELMAKPNFTKAIGIDMGIAITYSNQDTKDLQPEAKINSEGGYPAIKISKKGTSGFRIYSRVNGEGHFKYLDTCSGTKYIDVREKIDSQAFELREYTFFYIVKDVKVGKESIVYKFSF
jgi:hypothetical protein